MKVSAVALLLPVLIALAAGAFVKRPISDEERHNFQYPLRRLESTFQTALNRLTVGDGGNANEYMDKVMELVRQEIITEGLDNIALPDGNLGFNMTLWPFGTHFGGVKLYNGFLKGLETLNRVGDASLSTKGFTISLDSKIGVNDASMGYKMAVLFLDIGPKGSMSGQIDYVHLYLKATIDLMKKTVLIDTLDIQELGHVDTDIKGLGPIFNWLAELIANLAINLVKGVFKEIIEGPLKYILNKIISGLIPTAAGPLALFAAMY